MLFSSDAVNARFPGEMTLYVVPLHTIVPWLPFTGSAEAGAAIRTIASSAPAANALPGAMEPSFHLVSRRRYGALIAPARTPQEALITNQATFTVAGEAGALLM